MATAMFFAGAVPATYFTHGDALGISGSLDWSLDNQGRYFLGVALSLGTLWFASMCMTVKNDVNDNRKLVSLRIQSYAESCTELYPWQAVLRHLANFLASLAFAFSLRLSNMVDPHKVLTFLMLPFSSAFDPSLVFLAGGALPLATLLYRYARVEQPRFGGKWNIPTSDRVDLRLVLGSIIFGMGWGISGVCRTFTADPGQQYLKRIFISAGPGLINFGHSLYAGTGFMENAAWVVSMVLGGLLVG